MSGRSLETGGSKVKRRKKKAQLSDETVVSVSFQFRELRSKFFYRVSRRLREHAIVSLHPTSELYSDAVGHLLRTSFQFCSIEEGADKLGHQRPDDEVLVVQSLADERTDIERPCLKC